MHFAKKSSIILSVGKMLVYIFYRHVRVAEICKKNQVFPHEYLFPEYRKKNLDILILPHTDVTSLMDDL
jgi:hypothetical protein